MAVSGGTGAGSVTQPSPAGSADYQTEADYASFFVDALTAAFLLDPALAVSVPAQGSSVLYTTSLPLALQLSTAAAAAAFAAAASVGQQALLDGVKAQCPAVDGGSLAVSVSQAAAGATSLLLNVSATAAPADQAQFVAGCLSRLNGGALLAPALGPQHGVASVAVSGAATVATLYWVEVHCGQADASSVANMFNASSVSGRAMTLALRSHYFALGTAALVNAPVVLMPPPPPSPPPKPPPSPPRPPQSPLPRPPVVGRRQRVVRKLLVMNR